MTFYKLSYTLPLLLKLQNIFCINELWISPKFNHSNLLSLKVLSEANGPLPRRVPHSIGFFNDLLRDTCSATRLAPIII